MSNTLKTVRAVWDEWLASEAPAIVARYGEDDLDAFAQGWNAYTDAACTEGRLTGLQYHFGPDDDHAEVVLPDDADDVGGELQWLLDKLDVQVHFNEAIGEGPVGPGEYAATLQHDVNVVTWAITPSGRLSGVPDEGEVLLAIMETLDGDDESAIEAVQDLVGHHRDAMGDLQEVAGLDVSLYEARFVGITTFADPAAIAKAPGPR